MLHMPAPTLMGQTSLTPYPVALMTGPTTAGFTADASGELNSFSAWRAFDGNKNTFSSSWTTPSSASDKWLRLQLPQAARLIDYEIAAPGSGAGQYVPINWRIEGSNDGSSWSAVDVRSGQAGWVNGERRTFTLPEPSAEFLQFRLFYPYAAGDLNDGRQPYVNELSYSFVL